MRPMSLSTGDRHDVEDAACVRVFGIDELLATGEIVVGVLNLAVLPGAIGTFEEDAVIAVGLHGAADCGIGRLRLRIVDIRGPVDATLVIRPCAAHSSPSHGAD